MSDNFKLPDELLGGAVKVIRPTDLRNRVGLYMMEERGVKMGRNVDPGDVQDMIVEFTQREIEKVSTGEANGFRNERSGSNYTADHEIFPSVITFANDRVVRLITNRDGKSFLTVDPFPGPHQRTPSGAAEMRNMQQQRCGTRQRNATGC